MDDFEEFPHTEITPEQWQFAIDVHNKAKEEGTPAKRKWSRKSRLIRQLNRNIFKVFRLKEEIEAIERKLRLEDDSDDLLALARKLRDAALELETTLKNFQLDL